MDTYFNSIVSNDKRKKTIQVNGNCSAGIPDSKMKIIKTFEGFVHRPDGE